MAGMALRWGFDSTRACGMCCMRLACSKMPLACAKGVEKVSLHAPMMHKGIFACIKRAGSRIKFKLTTRPRSRSRTKINRRDWSKEALWNLMNDCTASCTGAQFGALFSTASPRLRAMTSLRTLNHLPFTFLSQFKLTPSQRILSHLQWPPEERAHDAKPLTELFGGKMI